MIRLKDLTIGYHSQALISDINIHISSGQLVALLGRNGTGKSTLLKAISALDKPQKGSVFLNKLDINKIEAEQLAKTIAFVTTDRVRIPNLRCKDIVALGRTPYTNWIGSLQKDDIQIINQSLELVGMQDYANRTMDHMSDGECQRVMIARALAQDTPIILLDEPTSFLDLPNRYELCSLLQRLAHHQNKCILFSTHELDIALTMCDSIALIDKPQLHYMSTKKMISSGHIERLFSSTSVSFDATNCTVRLK